LLFFLFPSFFFPFILVPWNGSDVPKYDKKQCVGNAKEREQKGKFMQKHS
jgi:hypothetical protein